MVTETIRANLAELDTHPVFTWTLKDQDGALLDLSPGARTVELWYWDNDHTGNEKKALWKKLLTKTAAAATPQEKAEVSFTAGASEPFYPAEYLLRGRGTRVFNGWLRYLDTSSTPPTAKWVKAALEITAEDAPTGP